MAQGVDGPHRYLSHPTLHFLCPPGLDHVHIRKCPAHQVTGGNLKPGPYNLDMMQVRDAMAGSSLKFLEDFRDENNPLWNTMCLPKYTRTPDC